MILNAEINQQGYLSLQIPNPAFWGKQIILSIIEVNDSPDETAYLLSSPANEQRLVQARQEFERGEWVEVEDLDELFQ